MAFNGRISFDGDEGVADSLVKVASAKADELRSWKDLMGMSHVVKVFDLPDGATVTIVDAEYMRTMHISAPSRVPDITLEEVDEEVRSAVVGVADVVSGVVTASSISYVVIEHGTGERKVQATVPAVNAIVPTAATSARYSNLFMRAKVGVPEESPLMTVGSSSEHFQGRFTKPSKYSGKMRKLVQLLLGLGYIRKDTAEMKWLEADEDRAELTNELTDIDTQEVEEVVSEFGLPDELPTYGNEVPYRVTYDYRWATTHGVVKGLDGNMYVARISSSGVHAMRLYMDPVSMTEEGRERYITVSPELTEFIDEFNGFPAALPFPVTSQLKEYIDAGEVIELLPKAGVQSFYSLVPYSSDIGWCFNDKGVEAHNTGWDWVGGVKRGYHYAVAFNIVRTKPFIDSSSGLALADLLKGKGYHFVNKARRMTERQAKSIVETWSKDPDTGFKALKDAIVDPSIEGTAKLARVSEGSLYHPSKHLPPSSDFQSIFGIHGSSPQPQIKFPETLVDGLVSFDLIASDEYRNAGNVPVACDTTMFVMFDGDDLLKVNYFYETREYDDPPEEEELGPCDRVIGSWTIVNIGLAALYGNFYTSVTDDRETLKDYNVEAVTNAAPVGSFTHYSATAFYSRCLTASGYTKVRSVTNTKVRTGEQSACSITIPFGERCSFYTHYYYETSGVSCYDLEEEVYDSYYGGTTDFYEVEHYLLHWVGSCGFSKRNFECHAAKVGTVTSEACLERDPVALQYSTCPKNGKPKSIISGPAGKGGLGSYSVPPQLDIPNRSLTKNLGRVVKRRTHVYLPIHGLVKIAVEEASGEDENGRQGYVDYHSLDQSTWWFKPSPDYDGAYAKLSVMSCCLGGDITNYEDDFGGTIKSIGGPSAFATSINACYVGVVE